MKRKSNARRAAAAPIDVAQSTPSVPLPPPELLERARKLGAISAGPAMFVAEGAILAATAAAGQSLRLPKRSAPSKARGGSKR